MKYIIVLCILTLKSLLSAVLYLIKDCVNVNALCCPGHTESSECSIRLSIRTQCHMRQKNATSMPQFEEVSKGHYVACHRVNEIN